jgi:hypothetical protein
MTYKICILKHSKTENNVKECNAHQRNQIRRVLPSMRVFPAIATTGTAMQ